jgi:hypothetical protein
MRLQRWRSRKGFKERQDSSYRKELHRRIEEKKEPTKSKSILKLKYR